MPHSFRSILACRANRRQFPSRNKGPRFSQIHAAAMVAIRSFRREMAGCTVDPRALVSVRRNSWAVSLDGSEKRLKVLSLESLIQYLWTHRDIAYSRHDTYLGIWFDQETLEYCVDLSTLHSDKDEAIALADYRRQKAIFHLRFRELYFLTATSRKAA